MTSYENKKSDFTLGIRKNSAKGFSTRIVKLLLPCLIAVFMFVLFLAAGIDMGRPEIFDSFNYEYSDVEVGSALNPTVMLDGKEVNAAFAADIQNLNYNDARMNYNATYTNNFTGSGAIDKKVSSKGLNSGVGVGTLWIDGDYKIHKPSAVILMKFNLGGLMENLRQNKKLVLVSITGEFETRGGTDQKMRLGYYPGDINISNVSWQIANFPKYSTSGDLKSKGSKFYPTVTINEVPAQTFTIGWADWVISSAGWRECIANMNRLTFNFKSTDNVAPTFSRTLNYNDWAKQKNVTVAYSDEHSINLFISKTGSGTYTSSADGGNNRITFYNVTSALTAKATDRSNNTSSATFSMANLKIDRTAPTIGDITFCRTGTTTPITSPWSGGVDLRVPVTDNESGVKEVTLYNNDTKSNVNITPKVSGNTYIFTDIPNGNYTVTAKDKTKTTSGGDDPNTDTKSASFYLKDTKAPVLTYTLSKKTDANNFANGPVTISVTITDSTGDTNATTLSKTQNTSGIYSFKFFYSDGAGNKSGLSGYGASNAFANGTWTFTCKIDLPFYGISGPQSYTFRVEDKAGNVTTDTPTGESNIYAFIDTSMPAVTNFQATSGSANALRNWVSGNVILTVTVSDIPVSSCINKGSGLDKIELLTPDKTKVLNTYYFSRDTLLQTGTATFTIEENYDKYNCYYFRVYDRAGNTSDTPSSNRVIGGVTYTNYILNDVRMSNTPAVILKDSHPVVVSVYDSNNKLLAANGDIFTYAWSQDSSVSYKITATFGPSGGKLYCQTDGGSEREVSGASYLGANVTGGVSAIHNNQRSTTIIVSAEGIKSYIYNFRNGAGTVASSGTVYTRMDRTKPEQTKLLGFGTGFNSGNYTTESQIIGSINGFISESDLISSGWRNGNYNAYILLSDAFSGVSSASQEYNYINSGGQKVTAQQQSKAKAEITFKHNGYTYSFTSDYYQKNGNYQILIIPLWQTDEIAQKAVNGSGQKILHNGKLDILYGENVPFVYNIKCADFVGNYADVTNSSNKTDLAYTVDPYELEFKITSITTNSGAYSSVFSHKNWTKEDIIVTLEKTKMGLSAARFSYSTRTLNDSLNDGGASNYPLANANWIDATEDGGTSRNAKIVLYAYKSRLDQMFIKLYSDADSTGTTMVKYNGEYICLRQDTDAPTLKAIFFSTNPNLTSNPIIDGIISNDVLLYYIAEYKDSNYTFKRSTANNAENIWVYKKVYLYIVATDATGDGNNKGLGSGINFIQFTINGVTEKLFTAQQADGTPSSMVSYSEDFVGIYRSNNTYGYQSARDIYGINFTLEDNQKIPAKINALTDSDGRKLLPIVDGTIPTVTIERATYGVPPVSYLGSDGRMIGSADNVIRSNLLLNFRYISGISGVQIYYREREIGVPLDPNDPILYYNSSRVTPAKYGFVTTAGIDLSEWQAISGAGITNTGDAGALWNFEINSERAIKNRYDILIVNGAGVYYYMDGGDVFIDTVPPEIFEDLTFYSLVGNEYNNNPIIPYDSLSIIQANTFTNDDVYVYFYIEDSASGVADVYYYKGVGGEKISLEKVLVRRTVNGVESVKTYYRMLITDSTTYKIAAVDKAKNEREGTAFALSIDKYPIGLEIRTTTDNGGNYTSGKFTNGNYITITLDVSCGLSSFKEVQYSTDGINYSVLSTDNLLNSGDWRKVGFGAQVSFTIAHEQNQTYYFRAFNNVLSENAKDGIIPMTEKNITVSIDRTAPSVDKYDKLSNFNYIESEWHSEGQVLKLKANDLPALSGSGIAAIKLDYRVNGVAQDAVMFVLNQDGYYYPMVNGKAFTMDYYTVYTIKLTDAAGNSTEVDILPMIDSVVPTFGNFNTDEVLQLWTRKAFDDLEELDEVRYTAGTWSKMNIDALINAVYSISGARLQFSRAARDTTAFTQWADSGTIFEWGALSTSDGGKTKTERNVSFLLQVLQENSLNYTYKLRIVSESGLISEELILGQIMIDKVKPNITVDVRINNNSTDHGVKVEDNRTSIDKWTDNTISINVATNSTMVSGYSIYYNLVQNGEPNWQQITGSFVNMNGFTFDYNAKLLVHSIMNSTNNENYQYYFESNSGMRSDIYYVEGVKIDKLNPSFNVYGEISDIYGTPQGGEKLNTANASDFTGAQELYYNLANPVWTNRNSVIIKVDIDKVNYSGLYLYINNILYEKFEYGTPDKTCRYYVVDKTGDYSVVIKTGASDTRKTSIANVRIDNAIPVFYVAGIQGTKSTNWDDTLENSWYTDITTFNFVIGTLTDNGSERYGFNEKVPASGYRVEYSISTDADESLWTWQTCFESDYASGIFRITGMPYEQNAYKFRIVSNSGMSYTMGKAAYDNASVARLSVEESKEIVRERNGIIKHLSETDFVYNMNVDSNIYYINTAQLLELNINGRDILVTSNGFADYTFYKRINGSFQQMGISDYEYRRGDFIKVAYSTNDYIHRYTDYGVVDESGAWVEGRKNTYTSDADTELSGEFTFQFSDSSVKINSYFMKELEVIYGETVMYKQSQSEASVTAHTTFTYRTDAGATDTVSIPLEIIYRTMNGVEADPANLALGGYIVDVIVAGSNANSFRLSNPKTVLLVKYFTEKLTAEGQEIANSVSNPYTIAEQADLAYISADYYTGYEENGGEFVLNAPLSYLNSAYTLTSDLTLSADFTGIEGEFKGNFFGGDHTVTLSGGRIEYSEYGFFKVLGGDVSNLVLALDGEVSFHNVNKAGILAAEITGGSVRSVRVSGEFNIIGALSGANVGGLAGTISNASVGNAGEIIYVDVVINNLGNYIAEANIGGLVGYIGEQAVINHTYTYSHITVYNVSPNVKVAAVAGSAAVTNYADGAEYNAYFNNRYLSGDVFVNDESKLGFIGVESNINDASESKNTVKGLNYTDFIGVGNGQIGATVAVGKPIRFLVLDRLYADFGVIESEEGVYGSGTGIESDPFVISTVTQLRTVDKYVNLHYSLTENLDLTGFGESIGLHKVFAGEFNGNEKQLTGFGTGLDISDGDRIGLFAEVSGQVSNLIFLDVNVEFNGNIDDLNAGVVAAKLSGGTVNNIIAIGEMNITNGNGTVSVGAIAGTAQDGTVYDVFSIVNIKAAGSETMVGGIIGLAQNVRMSTYTDEFLNEKTGAVFALGRVEANAPTALAGAVIADGDLSGNSDTAYAVPSNAYSNSIPVSRTVSEFVRFEQFDSTAMRNTAFSNGTNVFNKVFKTDNLYYLSGMGISTDKFAITTAEEFAYIDHMLYASYNISKDITFTDFTTIGKGLVFTGSIDGKNADSWSAEEGTVSSLMNVTDALVYNNAGQITDIGINVYFEKVISVNEDVVFGAVAIYNSTGTIRNVTVSGNIDITSLNKNSTVIVSGFVGIAEGGVIEGDSKVQNSISGLNISVANVGMVYAGGYIGKVDGAMTLSYGIGNGTLEINDCGTVYAGTLVGAAYEECNWSSIDETEEYRYIVVVDEVYRTDLFGYSAK